MSLTESRSRLAQGGRPEATFGGVICSFRWGACLPKISEFFGIAIYLYYDDHPPPHFHAQYAEFEAVIQIEDLSVVRGKLPPRALGLVVEWATLHREELGDVWRQAQAMETLSKIPPLE